VTALGSGANGARATRLPGIAQVATARPRTNAIGLTIPFIVTTLDLSPRTKACSLPTTGPHTQIPRSVASWTTCVKP
jgi:hypothetical protein